MSPVVVDELSEGDYPTKRACLQLVSDLPMLAVNEDVIAIAEAYQASHVMPGPPVVSAGSAWVGVVRPSLPTWQVAQPIVVTPRVVEGASGPH